MKNTEDIFVKEEPELDSWQDIIRKDHCKHKKGALQGMLWKMQKGTKIPG